MSSLRTQILLWYIVRFSIDLEHPEKIIRFIFANKLKKNLNVFLYQKYIKKKICILPSSFWINSRTSRCLTQSKSTLISSTNPETRDIFESWSWKSIPSVWKYEMNSLKTAKVNLPSEFVLKTLKNHRFTPGNRDLWRMENERFWVQKTISHHVEVQKFSKNQFSKIRACNFV